MALSLDKLLHTGTRLYISMTLYLILNFAKYRDSKVKPLAYFFGKKVKFFSFFSNLHFQNDHFGMFIVLKLHRESLRQMMNQGRANHSIKIQVLESLKDQVRGDAHHGDIKEFLVVTYK